MRRSEPQHEYDYRAPIKAALKQQGVTLADIAKELEISAASVSIVLTGERRSRRIAEHVARILNTTVDELFPGVYLSMEPRS